MFEYNEETRIHFIDGKWVPSVTQVIERLSDFSMIPSSVLERKTELGTQFHKAVEYYLSGRLDFESLDPALVPPFESFIKWQKDNLDVDDVVMAETPLCDTRRMFLGKCDIVTSSKIIDIKLRLFNPVTDYLQMAGYDRLCKLETGQKKYELEVLSFSLSGALKIHNGYHRQAWPIFSEMLTKWHADLEHQNLLSSWKKQF